MNSLLAAAAQVGSSTPNFTWGQTLFFWVAAPLIVVLALGVLLFKKAMHSAICMVGVMLGLAMMYVSLTATFIGVVQVVVYTGAVMTLIMFIIMLLGVAASDHYKRTSGVLRGFAVALGVAAGVGVVSTFVLAYLPAYGELPPTDSEKGLVTSNPVIIGINMFQEHVLSVEVVSALLIIAVIGAMTLTHTDRITKAFNQEETAVARMLEYADRGTHPGQQPAPGVYQQSNSADVPALDGETETALVSSVSPALRARGSARPLGQASPTTIQKIRADKYGDPAQGLHSLAASRAVGLSGAWGMKGSAAPETLQAPQPRKLSPAAARAASAPEDADSTVAPPAPPPGETSPESPAPQTKEGQE